MYRIAPDVAWEMFYNMKHYVSKQKGELIFAKVNKFKGKVCSRENIINKNILD